MIFNRYAESEDLLLVAAPSTVTGRRPPIWRGPVEILRTHRPVTVLRPLCEEPLPACVTFVHCVLQRS